MKERCNQVAQRNVEQTFLFQRRTEQATMEYDNPKSARTDSYKGGAGRGFRTTRTWPPANRICCICRKLVPAAHRILPYMNVYACDTCVSKGYCLLIAEYEVTNKVFAPWSAEQVERQREYQGLTLFLPFVCRLEHVLVPEPEGYFCAECPEFKLTWTYPWILDGSWRNDLKLHGRHHRD